MLVDEDETTHLHILFLLEKYGHETIVAENGKKHLELLEENKMRLPKRFSPPNCDTRTRK